MTLKQSGAQVIFFHAEYFVMTVWKAQVPNYLNQLWWSWINTGCVKFLSYLCSRARSFSFRVLFLYSSSDFAILSLKTLPPLSNIHWSWVNNYRRRQSEWFHWEILTGSFHKNVTKICKWEQKSESRSFTSTRRRTPAGPSNNISIWERGGEV